MSKGITPSSSLTPLRRAKQLFTLTCISCLGCMLFGCRGGDDVVLDGFSDGETDTIQSVDDGFVSKGPVNLETEDLEALSKHIIAYLGLDINLELIYSDAQWTRIVGGSANGPDAAGITQVSTDQQIPCAVSGRIEEHKTSNEIEQTHQACVEIGVAQTSGEARYVKRSDATLQIERDINVMHADEQIDARVEYVQEAMITLDQPNTTSSILLNTDENGDVNPYDELLGTSATLSINSLFYDGTTDTAVRLTNFDIRFINESSTFETGGVKEVEVDGAVEFEEVGSVNVTSISEHPLVFAPGAFSHGGIRMTSDANSYTVDVVFNTPTSGYINIDPDGDGIIDQSFIF